MNKQAITTLVEQYSSIFLSCRSRHTATDGDPALTNQQEHVLTHLDENEGTTLLHLSQQIGVTPATMFYHVDRLVKKGFVLRVQATEDRREVSLRLTASGAKVLAAKSLLDPERVGALLDQLNEDELETVLQGFAILGRAADQLSPQNLSGSAEQENVDVQSAAKTQRAPQVKPAKQKHEPKITEPESEETEADETEDLKARAPRATPIHFADTAW